MHRTSLLLLTALFVAASSARAQEVKDGTYTNKDLKIRFSVPKDYGIRTDKESFQWKWYASVCEVYSDDKWVGGALTYQERAMKLEKFAEMRHNDLLKAKGVTNVKIVKSEALKDKKEGEWLLRVHEYESGDYEYIQIHVYIAKGKHNYELSLWTNKNVYDEYKEPMQKIVDSLEFGDSVLTEAKTEPKAAEPKTPETKSDAKEWPVASDPWKGCGKGSWVKYTMKASGMEMESIYTLLEHEDGKSYTMRTDSVIAGNKMEGQPTKYVVKKPDESGGKTEPAEKPQVETGEETVKVPKGEYKCKWTKTTTKQGWSKVWMCDDVPFGMVKMESEYSGAKSTLELADFEKK